MKPLFRAKLDEKKILSMTLILTVAFSALMAGISIVNAGSTPLRFTLYYEYHIIGVNQPIRFGVEAAPRIFTSPPYNTQAEVMSDATVTFTRPDGTTDIVHGPFRIDWVRRVVVLVDYTPNQVGDWTFQFTWPGDATYAAASVSGQFTVQQAQIPKRDTTASLSFRPNPIGKGQTLLVNAWITPRPIIPGDWYEGYNFIITKPDGTTESRGPMKSYGEGSVWFEYVPNQIGQYTIQFTWAGAVFENGASTQKQSLTVQEQAVPSWPAAALPSEQWTYPVNPENREWASINGPYLVPTGSTALGYDCTGQRYNPYSKGPNTAHINWMIPPVTGVGGLVGGQWGQTIDYAVTAASIDVVMAGKAYYQAGGKIYCLDVITGKQLWNISGSYTFGLIEGTTTLTQTPVLVKIGTAGNTPTAGNLSLVKYDALTGAKILDVTISSDAGAKYMFLAMDYTYAYVAQAAANVDENYGPCKLLKVKITGTETTGRLIYSTNYPFGIVDIGVCLYGDVLTRWAFGITGPSGAVNTTSGQVLWSGQIEDVLGITLEAKPEHATSANGIEFLAGSGGYYIAFNMATGKVKWASEKTDYPWGDFWAYGHSTAYGKLFALSYAGVYAFDQETGKIKWHYTSGDSGFETPYSTWPFGYNDPIVADGKVYAPTSEHTPAIYYRGQQLHAINAETGDKVWSIMGYYNVPAIAEGTLFANNAYDGYAYAFAKGETTTSVSVSSKVVAKGSAMLIEGTVMDQSPAQPNTPAISDADMSAWMEYLHMQQPIPCEAKGVAVSLTAIDSNGNPTNIGTTTSDNSGNYAYTWAPQTEGTYMIVASFAGSESYYASYSETAVSVTTTVAASASPTVSPGVSATPTPSVAPTPPGITAGTEIFIIVAVVVIIIVVAVAALFLRKRK